MPGAAVFMTSAFAGTPPPLLHNFVHNRVVHQHIVLLTIVTDQAAHVTAATRCTREELELGFVRLIAPDVATDVEDDDAVRGADGVAKGEARRTLFDGALIHDREGRGESGRLSRVVAGGPRNPPPLWANRWRALTNGNAPIVGGFAGPRATGEK